MFLVGLTPIHFGFHPQELLQHEDASLLINESDFYGCTPLHVAAMKGYALVTEVSGGVFPSSVLGPSFLLQLVPQCGFLRRKLLAERKMDEMNVFGYSIRTRRASIYLQFYITLTATLVSNCFNIITIIIIVVIIVFIFLIGY